MDVEIKTPERPKKIAILQSNYIPWKGYFDLIASVDELIIYDEMQYTRRDWRNRNYIKTPQGTQWLTVPVLVKGRFQQKICETEIDGTAWAATHWASLTTNYRRATYFSEISNWLEPIYSQNNFTHLSQLNIHIINEICMYLGIETVIKSSSEYTLANGKTERLISLCIQAGASEYVSGPAAKNYIDESTFSKNQIRLTWFDYADYPEYPQLWHSFNHGVTILDLLFNCGKNSASYMKYVL
jgi:WbqC-like protein family